MLSDVSKKLTKLAQNYSSDGCYPHSVQMHENIEVVQQSINQSINSRLL